ncbi:hypothetical protein EJV46_17200 [Roseococcus sp. SYP-B2431]|uniref:hypothetical protein n=1 Tax=Roseococcus sp. SYP-B2431 TaxID=2496640 RepID=UPI00103A3BFD|nr:hypothetical protein [Roseococcus sp. SYP-B2431]TCH97059.1 hypothetical protein EJV46_17200 [Roseococcus sp. SYP-B2431]
MAATVVTYIRGDKYVSNIPKSGAAAAHGLVGELLVGGQSYRTIERMDNYMSMAGSRDYTNSTMYWFEKYGSYVINPWLGREAEKKKYNILFHPASVPSHLEGCVGVGCLDASGVMSEGKASFTQIWEACGGAIGRKKGQIVITLRVQGEMKRRSACTAWTAG